MPRKPTRSKNSKRPTRKNLDRRLDGVSEDDYGDVKKLTLAEVIGYETEVVDEEAGIVKIVETGELRQQVSVDDEIMAGLKEVHGDQ